jgi:transposase
MIRIDGYWLATEPMDMRAGAETALARVIAVFGQAKPRQAYLFTNKRATRLKVLVHDGLGVWLCSRRLNQGKFHWLRPGHGETLNLRLEQCQALVQGLPWHRMDQAITLS